MRQKTNFEDESALASAPFGGHWWLWGSVTNDLPATTLASCALTSHAQLQSSLNHRRSVLSAFSARSFLFAPVAGSLPGMLFDTHEQSPAGSPAPPGRPDVEKPESTDSFHNSESEDIFDLYNACNGIVRNGLLDIDELGKLTRQESEALNVSKLKDIWRHTASGCARCANIIEILNLARQTLAQELESFLGQNEAVDLNVVEAIDSVS